MTKTSATVRLIYKLYLDGATLRQIAQHLTDLKIPKRECTEWNLIAVRSILSNEKYVGDALLQKTYTVDCIHTRKPRITENVLNILSPMHMMR